ncbi:MAG: hypothetical protein HY961_01500 [Ignavibacteriae bacterium]|nr:hypothetical protein [Ignavibacteriota bacterium]
MKSTQATTLIIMTLLSTAIVRGQGTHDLPLVVTSANAEHWQDVVEKEEDYIISIVREHIVGHIFRVTIGFMIEDEHFWQDPTFSIFAAHPDGFVERIEVDTTSMYSKCDNCLEVTFEISTTRPGWLACYCFPSDYEILRPTREYLARTGVQRLIYLRLWY